MRITRRACLAMAPAIGFAGESPLVREWQRIAARSGGAVGVSVLRLDTGVHEALNGGQRFPLASVCKLPIAIAILNQVDEGRLSLAQEIEIPSYDVVPTVSPVAERWPQQKRFPLGELIELMIARSDNTAVQTLFRIAGDGAGMAARFRQWGIAGMRVDRSERRCGLDAAGVTEIPPVAQWTPNMAAELTARIPPRRRLAAMRRFLADPRDSATPDASVQLLARAFRGQLLSKALTARLVEILQGTTTGPGRIRALLPPGTVVAHKTGTTATAAGFNGSTNDVGVIGGRLAIAVYLKGSTRDEAARERTIAEIARAAFGANA